MSQPIEKVVKRREEWLADTNPIPGHVLAVIAETGECRLGNDSATFTQLLNLNPTGVKIYRANLTQADTDAPVATVLENTLGGTVVWTRSSAGLYLGTLADAFVENKTVVAHNNPTVGGVMSVGWAGTEAIQIQTAEISIDFGGEEITWASADNLFGFGVFVQVLVYP